VQSELKVFSYKILFFVFVGFLGLFHGTEAFGQKKVNNDSLRIARQRVIDSTRLEQQHIQDSARSARLRLTDSISRGRKRVSDSLAVIKKYRESKHYKDSVATVRKLKADSIKTVRTAQFDSIRLARQKFNDSLTLARKQSIDALKAIQKRKTDSLNLVRSYRNSKRYKDSVEVARTIKTDSARTARKELNDKLVASRKKSMDSSAAIRKHFTDSVSVVRKKYTDSLAVVRKKKADSLAKAAENKERLAKSKENLKLEKLQLQLDLKVKKKREAWSNEKMLKKKWTPPRKFFQNTYTHYNYYFNADRKMDEALLNMQRMRKENYDSTIALFPFNPDRDSTVLASDMDSIIQKASVGIQIHDPRASWADDLYLLLGEAYYYKGNYSEAATAFQYIISSNQQEKLKKAKKNAAKRKPVDKTNPSILEEEKKSALDFLKHKSVNNEAILWLARTYTQSHREGDAESILDLLDSDEKMPDELKGRLALEKAYLNLSKGNTAEAANQLTTVADDKHIPGWLRERAAFLNGQLRYEQGDFAGAASSFQNVLDMKPKIEMDFYARKNLAYSQMEMGGSQESATASLKKILKDGKYLPYYEQVYYVLGRLAAGSNNYNDAVTYLKKSIASAKATKKQKAISFAALGNVYYGKGEYRAAKLAYDSATSFLRYAPNDSLVLTAERRAKVLDQVAGPTDIIHSQDSLLALAARSEKEQRSMVRQYILSLERRMDDSAFRAENNNAVVSAPEDADPGMGGGGNWYFSSPALLQAGAIEFKRKWGARPNVDNWRRISAVGNNAGNNNNIDNDAVEITENASVEVDERGLPTEASLLALIPNTEEEKMIAHRKIQRAYIDLASAYIQQLEEYPRGLQTLDTLNRKYTNHQFQAEALYLKYKVALKQNKLEEAQELGNRLQKEFGTSKWAREVTPTQPVEGLLASNTVTVSNYYDETYDMMLQRQYGSVLQRVRQGQRDYQDPVYNNRFRIMEGIALAGSGNYDQADTVLSDFISKHPGDSLRYWAEAVLNHVKKNKPIPPPIDTTGKSAGINTGSLLPLDSALVPPNPASTIPAVTPAPASYGYQPKDPHYVVFLFNKVESRTMGVKAALNDYNVFKYGNQNLATQMEVLQPDQGLIIVKSFQTMNHAKIYMNSVKGNAQVFREYKPSDYQVVLISENNLKKLVKDKDINPYLKFYKTNY
jgi:tetratricopeptide (TPR) repeat protein